MFLRPHRQSTKKTRPARRRRFRLESLETRRVLAAPVPGTDFFNAPSGAGGVPLDVLQNDTDPDGDQLSIVDAGTPTSGGFVSFTDPQILFYFPPNGFQGTDSFTYTVSDGSETAEGYVSVIVSPNQSPYAADDYVEVQANGNLSRDGIEIDVLSSDTDPDGQPLQIIQIGSAQNGGASDNGTGTLQYYPNDGFLGNDSFTYTISDGAGGTAVGNVFVTIHPSGNGPTATPDSAATAPNENVIINLLENDISPSGDLTVTQIIQPTNGTVFDLGFGVVEYSPLGNFVGSDSFMYTISDPFGQTSQTTVSITIGGDGPDFGSITINGGIENPPDLNVGPQPTSWQNQRSDIRRVELEFDADLAPVQLGDIVMTNLGLDADAEPDVVVNLDTPEVTLSTDGNILRLDFDSYFLADGAYQIDGTVTDLGGASLPFSVAANPVNAFYKVAGEWNGDLGVSIFDLSAFSYWFAQPIGVAPTYIDLNGDNGVSIFDFSFFAGNFATGVVYPTARGLLAPTDEAAPEAARPVIDVLAEDVATDIQRPIEWNVERRNSDSSDSTANDPREQLEADFWANVLD